MEMEGKIPLTMTPSDWRSSCSFFCSSGNSPAMVISKFTTPPVCVIERLCRTGARFWLVSPALGLVKRRLGGERGYRTGKTCVNYRRTMVIVFLSLSERCCAELLT